MKNFQKHIILLILVSIFSFKNTTILLAQNTDQQEYISTALEDHGDKTAVWDEATEGLDFSKRKKKKKKKKEKRETETNTNTPARDRNFQGNNSIFGNGDFSGFFKIMFFVVVIGLLTYLMMKIAGGTAFLSNRKVEKEEIGYSIENVEANLQKADLEGFARHALDKQDYKLAIRLYYLQIIKILNQNKLIKWKRDKTNNEYIREMRPSTYFKDFRSITRLFERVWYGDVNVQEKEFEQLRPKFLTLIQELTGKK